MTFAAYEESPYSGTPERLFLFQCGNQQWAYVNHAKPVLRGALTYQPEIISMGNLVQNLGEAPPNIDISVSSSAAVVQQFIPYLPIFPLQVTVFRRHRDDPDNQYLVEMMGEVASCAFDEEQDMATLQCRMVSSNVDRKAPWQIYQPPCNHALYGAGCQVNREDYKTVAIISDIVEDRLYSSAFATKPDGWFTAGFIKRESTGEIRFIIGHVGNEITLQSPFVDLNVGDEAPAYAGCDRQFSTCKIKFNNGNRFLGFPWVPTKNPFTDNIYGTGASGSGGAASQPSSFISLIASVVNAGGTSPVVTPPSGPAVPLINKEFQSAGSWIVKRQDAVPGFSYDTAAAGQRRSGVLRWQSGPLASSGFDFGDIIENPAVAVGTGGRVGAELWVRCTAISGATASDYAFVFVGIQTYEDAACTIPVGTIARTGEAQFRETGPWRLLVLNLDQLPVGRYCRFAILAMTNVNVTLEFDTADWTFDPAAWNTRGQP